MYLKQAFVLRSFRRNFRCSVFRRTNISIGLFRQQRVLRFQDYPDIPPEQRLPKNLSFLRRHHSIFYQTVPCYDPPSFCRIFIQLRISAIESLLPVIIVKNVTAFRAKLRRILWVFRLPAALVTSVNRCT